jgi:RHS repeat-associated protein
VTAPAPTPGAARPQTRYSYTLTSGEYRLTGVSACKTGASCTGTADEVTASATYNADGTLASTTSGNGSGTLAASTAMTYDAMGNPITIDGPLPGSADTVRMRYNAARERIGTVSPDPDGSGPLKHRASRVTLDATSGLATKTEQGTVNSQSDGDWAAFASLEAVETGYDANARPTVQKLVAGGTTYALSQVSYDALGRPECTAQRMNPAAFGALPASACTPGTQGSHGPDRIARTIRDAAGQVTQVKTALGTADEANEVTSTYRSNGQVETVTDGENNKTSYQYDGHDRLSRTHYPVAAKGANASNPNDYEELGYDAGGNVVSRRVRDGQVIGYSYDALNRMTGKNLPNSAVYEHDVSYGYDLLGRLVGAGDSLGHQQSFGYDALGRRLSESSNWYGTTSSEFDLAGRRTRLTWRDGFFVTYEHLATGETSAIRENGGFVLAGFSYDDLGRRTSLTRGNGTVTGYGYDAVSRLGSLSNELAGTANDLTLGFTHNPAGQIAANTRSNDLFAWTGSAIGTTGSAANGLNQLTQAGAVTPSYDVRGNMTANGVTSFGYTSENRLASSPSSNQYYDALGRLVHLTGSVTDFLYHGGEIIQEVEGGGPTRRRFVHGPGSDEPLVWYEGAGTGDRRYLHADERGSVVAVSDGSGNAIGINKYDEYGVPAATNIGRFGYTGQVWLGELDLWYYKARMYDPRLGRFLQPDPIGYGDGMNRYAYVGGDPVNFTDPSGLEEEEEREEIVVTGKRCSGFWIGDICVQPMDFDLGNFSPSLRFGSLSSEWPLGGDIVTRVLDEMQRVIRCRVTNWGVRVDASTFVREGGGVSMGADFNKRTGDWTGFLTMREGKGLGFNYGVGVYMGDQSTPSAGVSQSERAGVSGPVGIEASRSGGKTNVEFSVMLGARASAEYSTGKNNTKTTTWNGKPSPAANEGC